MRRIIRACAAVVAAGLLLSSCASGDSWREQEHEIAGGDPSGVYYNYASHLARLASRDLSMQIEAVESQGSVDNLTRVSAGEALAGFAQGDTAVDAVLGEGSFSEPLSVRAMARVYDEYVHIVVPRDSEVQSLQDLAGRVVSLGSEGSGVQVIAFRVLHAAGVEPQSMTNLALGLEESIAAMQQGEIAAFFWVGGLPTPGIERLERAMPIRLLSIEAGLVEQVNAGHAGVYRVADFPVGFYGLDGATETMTVPNYLIAAETAPDDLVYELLRVLFDSRTDIAANVTAAGYLDRRQAIFTGPLELHPGAARYYVDMRR